jgi:hypothetical protein
LTNCRRNTLGQKMLETKQSPTEIIGGMIRRELSLAKTTQS